MIIAILSNIPQKGGPRSFYNNLFKSFSCKGNRLIHFSKVRCGDVDAALVINCFTSFRALLFIFVLKVRGIKIVYRLGAPYRLAKAKDEMSFFVRLRYLFINYFILLQAFVFANEVVFQSFYVKNQWPSLRSKKFKIIYNSTPHWSPVMRLPKYTGSEPPFFFALEQGFSAVDVNYSENTSKLLQHRINVYGANSITSTPSLNIYLSLTHEEVIDLFNKNNNFLVILDRTPACPNSLFEALRCGVIPILPDAGACREIMPSDFPFFFDTASFTCFDRKSLDDIKCLNFWSENLKQHAEKFSASAMEKAYLQAFKK